MDESAEPPAAGLPDFDAVYQREFSYVWRTLGRFGVPAADIPDAVHDVFVVLYRRAHELERERPLRPWLFGVARKVAASRRRKLRPSLEPEAETSTGDDDRIAKRDLLWKVLATLDDDRRDVIILHDLEGHTAVEIADQLGISANTVQSRLRLGRAELVVAIERLRAQP
jgi:RNA polymerase sigma-70 factor (ECF subfamily)